MDLQEQYDKIYRYCYFNVKNTAIAEDLTQETFLKYFGQTSYQNRGKPLAYLYTIAKHLCIDHFTNQKIFLSIDEEAQNLTVGAQDTEMKITIDQAIQTLPEEIQELIMLRYSNELKITEIAAFTGISRFAVRRKLSAAIKQLKQLLREEDFFE